MKKNDKLRFILGWLITAAAFSGVGVGLLIWNELKGGKEPENPSIQAIDNNQNQPITNSDEDKQRFSSGDRYLLLSHSQIAGEALDVIIEGTYDFQSENYSQASEHFQEAINKAPNEPEPQIYLNNSLARQSSQEPLKFAVVVPVDGNPNSAKEMLRGVADAQTEFNQQGLDNPLLEIVIVNDGNNPDISPRVAKIIAEDQTILGVIGHNSSNASSAALPLYENAGLPMISPTSTSIDLKGDVFFRTVPSDAAAGKKLADYIINRLEIKTVAIFYDSNSNYSRSLKIGFEDRFDGGDRYSQSINLNDPDLDAKISETLDNNNIWAAILFPSTKTTNIALKAAKENIRLPASSRLRLFGGDALYKPETLTEGRATVEGLILAVPWFARAGEESTLDYAERAKNRWGGNVSWRTAMSYDATKALIEALSKNATRQTVLENLKKVSLSANETSGYLLQFDKDGERSGEVLLVEVAPGAPGPPGTNLGFQLLE